MTAGALEERSEKGVCTLVATNEPGLAEALATEVVFLHEGEVVAHGSPSDLLDADTNLKYALKYLRGAWLLSDGDHGTAIKWYARGYYYEAKKRGMLVETGLRDG